MIRIVFDNGEALDLLDLGQQHDLTSTPTDNPVEDGSDVTDNIRDDLDPFAATVFVSNSMLRAEGTQMDGAVETTTSIDLPSGGKMQVRGLTQYVDRVKLVYETLLAAKRARRTCTIVTPLRTISGRTSGATTVTAAPAATSP